MIRTLLGAAAQFYVSIIGSDLAGDGSQGAPWATFQHASDVIAQTIDTGGQNVTVQGVCGAPPCVWGAGVQLLAPYLGGGSVTFQGDLLHPENQVISVNAAACFQATFPAAQFRVGGFKCTNVAGDGIYASAGAMVWVTGPMEFGPVAQAQFESNGGYIINTATRWTVSGGGAKHIYVHGGGQFENAMGLTVAMVGNPAFTNVIYAASLGMAELGSIIYSGPCSGQKYVALWNAVLETYGAGPDYFCGSLPGGTAFGGIYK